MQLYSMTHCLQSSLRKRYAWKLESSFIIETAKDHVLRSKQIRNVNHKIYLVKKQDHLENTKQSAKLAGDRMQHRGLPNPTHISLNGSRARWTKTTSNRQVDREVWIPKIQGTISSRYEPDADRSTSSVKHCKSCWKTWIKQKSSSSARTHKKFGARTANLLRKLGSFIADADKIQSTIETLNLTSIVILLRVIS